MFFADCALEFEHPPHSLKGQDKTKRDFAEIFESVKWTVSVLNHEPSWPAKDCYPFPEELVKIMIQCCEHVLYKNGDRI
jgi:hypothetical protein